MANCFFEISEFRFRYSLNCENTCFVSGTKSLYSDLSFHAIPMTRLKGTASFGDSWEPLSLSESKWAKACIEECGYIGTGASVKSTSITS